MAYDLFGNGRSVIRAGFGQFFQRDRVNIQLEFAGNPPFRSSINGIRKFDEPPEACTDCGLGRPTSGIDPDFQTPYNLQFNAAWEQRVGRSSTIEVAYVGSRGRHLTRRSDINQVASGDNNGNGIPDRLEYVTAPEGDAGLGVRGALRPYSVFGDGTILFWESSGISEYNSLQTPVRAPVRHRPRSSRPRTPSRVSSPTIRSTTRAPACPPVPSRTARTPSSISATRACTVITYSAPT